MRSEMEGESEVESPMQGEEGLEVDGELGSLGVRKESGATRR